MERSFYRVIGSLPGLSGIHCICVCCVVDVYAPSCSIAMASSPWLLNFTGLALEYPWIRSPSP